MRTLNTNTIKTMANIPFSSKLRDAVNNYYQYNPDTLMPLLMLALATQDQICISNSTSSEHIELCSLNPTEIVGYEWVSLDPVLRKRIKLAIHEKQSSIKVLASIDSSLKDISVGYKCKNRCFIKNLSIKNNKIYVDIDTLSSFQ